VRDADGVSGGLAHGLLERRLYKRAHGWAALDRTARTKWERMLREPSERRALEDELARAAGGAPGTVLIDLASLDTRDAPEDDWGEVGLRSGARTSYPFRGASAWRTLATRPPSEWPVSVYAAPRVVGRVGLRLARERSPVP
jgi:hypothetical protein